MLSEKKKCWVHSEKRLLPTRPSGWVERYREKSILGAKERLRSQTTTFKCDELI